MDKPLVRVAHEAQRPAAVQDIEESHGSKACPRENLFIHPKTFVTSDKKETIGTQEIHDGMAKTLIQTNQDAEKLATTQNIEESCDSYIETQMICDTIKKPSSPTAQNVPVSTMILDAATNPSPSKAPEPMTSSILESNACSNYNLLNDISTQNLPYLEAGAKRHPQVLDWFNTKPRGAFVGLFTDVTRILRTTRRRDLTDDDRNYIRECCAASEAVGFDAAWINYVHRCIESCGDGDELKRKLEEIEARTSTLRDELASAEASLVSLRDQASGLDNFIDL